MCAPCPHLEQAAGLPGPALEERPVPPRERHLHETYHPHYLSLFLVGASQRMPMWLANKTYGCYGERNASSGCG